MASVQRNGIVRRAGRFRVMPFPARAHTRVEMCAICILFIKIFTVMYCESDARTLNAIAN